jgi:hypothetical protein
VLSAKFALRLSENSRQASLWTPKRGHNGARSAVSPTLVSPRRTIMDVLTIFQTVSPLDFSHL